MRSLTASLLLPLFTLSLATALPAQDDPIAAGDAAWARRAEGRQGDRALAGPINEAVAAQGHTPIDWRIPDLG